MFQRLHGVQGVFERCTKRCLRKIIGQAKFSHDELLTAITEVKMVINSQPLSYMSADDLEEPLTPSHLIVGRRLQTTLTTTPMSSTQLQMARYLMSTINRFWERWRKEYLVELRKAHKQLPCPPSVSG